LGVLNDFDAISDGHSVTKAKPAPDLFLYAAEIMGITPNYCTVVVDAASGVHAALEANMLAVGIGPPERVGHAHLRYDSTADVDLDEILAYDW
jgi:beta-phosphoglucomutase-like phosphatase (HAD superfamily)